MAKPRLSDFDRGFEAGYKQGLEECGPLAGITGYFDRRSKVKKLGQGRERRVMAAAQEAAMEAEREELEAVKRAKRTLAELTGDAPEENPRGRKPADLEAARELYLYAVNTYELYPQRQAIENALRRKIKQGKYRSDLAPKAWKYLMDAAAKRYAVEFASSPSEWSRIFTPATREIAAREIYKTSRTKRTSAPTPARVGARTHPASRSG